jgi:hypothetical protein
MAQTISYEIVKNGYTFRDTIVLSDNQVMAKQDIEAEKLKRFDAWYLLITTPVENPNPEEPEVDNG